MEFPQGVMVLQVAYRVPRLPCHFAVSISSSIFVLDSPCSSCEERQDRDFSTSIVDHHNVQEAIVVFAQV